MSRTPRPLPVHLRSPMTMHRLMRGISIRQMAELTGLNPKTIGEIERGQSAPFMHTLCDIGVHIGQRLAWVPVSDSDDDTYVTQGESIEDHINALNDISERLTVHIAALCAEAQLARTSLASLHSITNG